MVGADMRSLPFLITLVRSKLSYGVTLIFAPSTSLSNEMLARRDAAVSRFADCRAEKSDIILFGTKRNGFSRRQNRSNVVVEFSQIASEIRQALNGMASQVFH